MDMKFEIEVVEPFRQLCHRVYGDGWVLYAPLFIRETYDTLLRRRDGK